MKKIIFLILNLAVAAIFAFALVGRSLADQTSIADKVESLENKLYRLQSQYNSLIIYLEIEEVKIPSDTKLVKIKSKSEMIDDICKRAENGDLK